MKNLNKDVEEILKGTTELKYIKSFENIDLLEKEMQKMIDQGYEFHFDYVLTPDKKAIYADTGIFSPLLPGGPLEGSNQFTDFIEGKIKGHSKLRFGDKVHPQIDKAYQFHIGINYLLWEKREIPKKKFIKNNPQLNLFRLP